MRLHLVVPGLIWPMAQARQFAADLALPALSALLGHATPVWAAASSYESWLAAAFGLKAPGVPHAWLRRRGEAQDPGPEPGAWLCADPVHLHFAREHLLLADASDLDITAEEARVLVEALNASFGDLGQFEACATDRWYLRAATPPAATFFPLNDVVGRPVAHFLPEGPDARLWQRTMNEAQIILHNHPLNAAREAAGRRTINSLWLWGAAPAPGPLSLPAPRLLADGPLPRGLARAAGIPAETLDTTRALAGPDGLVVIEDLLRPALQLDLDRWREALLSLEAAWFAPLLAALKARRVTALRLSAPGDRATLQLDLASRQLWKFWRGPRNLERLVPPAPPPTP